MKGTNQKKSFSTMVESHLQMRGWDIMYHLEMSFNDTEHLIEAFINRENNWTINMQIDPKIDEKLEQLVAKQNIQVINPIEKLICGCADHEEGHWSICPFDLEYGEDILYHIAEGLEAGGFGKNKVMELTPQVSNMFMDVIVNIIKGFDKKYGDAFFEGRGIRYCNEIQGQETSIDYLLFVDMQMKIYGRNGQKKRSLFEKIFARDKGPLDFRTMAEHHPSYKNIQKGSLELTKAIMPEPLADKAYKQPLDAYDAKLLIEELEKRELWGKKAELFAKVLAPYLKQAAQEGQDGKSQSGQGEKNGKSKGSCGFVQHLLKNPEIRKELIKIAMAKAGKRSGQVNGGEAGNAMIVPYLPVQESFEAIYENTAEEIVMNYFKESEEEDFTTFKLFHMQDRPLEENEQIAGEMRWSKVFFVPTPEGKKLQLYQKQVPYQIQEDLLPGKKSLEDMLFAVDVSGSMGWSGIPLDGSPYDLALRSVFGVINGLERLGRAAHAKFGLVLFGDKTEFSGWEDYYCLDKFKKLVFAGYQGGGTELNPAIMGKALQQNPNRFLSIIISDGDIANDAASIVKEYIDAGNDVIQFSIGKRTNFSNVIQGYGAVVVQVKHPNDLAGLVLEKTLGRYR